MVDPASDKVSRASPYSGTASRSLIHFAYGAFTLFDRPSQNRSAMDGVFDFAGHPHAALQPRTEVRFGLLPVRSPLLGESRLISTPRVTEMVQFTRYGFAGLCIHHAITGSLPLGYPIRSPTDHRICAPPRGFSQLVATFSAVWLQGIHHEPVVTIRLLS